MEMMTKAQGTKITLMNQRPKQSNLKIVNKGKIRSDHQWRNCLIQLTISTRVVVKDSGVWPPPNLPNLMQSRKKKH